MEEGSAGLDGLSYATGEDMLDAVVADLQNELGLDFVFVGELWGEDLDSIRTLSLHKGGEKQNNFEYRLRHTPCAEIMDHQACSFAAGVAETFPDDELLSQMEIQGYVGVPLSDESDRPLGIIVGLHRRRLGQAIIAQTTECFHRWRSRLAGELERRRTLRDLNKIVAGAQSASTRSLRGIAADAAAALHVDTAFILTQLPDSRELGVAALCHKGRSLALTRTVSRCLCERSPDQPLLLNGTLRGGDELVERFPEAKSYLSAPLLDRGGTRLGYFGVIHHRELRGRVYDSHVFRAFCGFASGELQRLQSEQIRLDMERQMLDSQRRESLGLLAGGIAHDFNNLLVGMLGNADLALLDVTPATTLHSHLQEIVDAGRQASALCQQMLAYAGRCQREKSTVDLKDLVHDVTQIVRSSIGSRHRVDIQLSEGASVRVDGSQMQQVLMNLLTNAAESFGDRSGSIHVSCGRLRCSAQDLERSVVGAGLPSGTYAYFRVSDTGCGMSPEVQSRLFEPFFTTKAKGHGLGMAAVLGIIEGHRGALQLTSDLGRGTTITVLLPCSEPENTRQDPMTQDSRDQIPALGSVLIVDDEPHVRRVLNKILQRCDYEVLAAANGNEALELLRRDTTRVKAAIVDYSMPGLDGPQTIAKLEEIAQVPALISSGYPESEVLAACSAAGASVAGVVNKPYRFEHLVAALHEVLDPASQRLPLN